MTTWTRETVTGTSTEEVRFDGLTVDSIVIDGTNIGHTDDLDLLALSSGTLTVNGNIAGTLTTAAQTNITSTGTLTALTVSGVTQLNNTLTVGVDDTGYDVKFFGDTSANYFLWQTSTNSLKIFGTSASQEHIQLSNNEDGTGKAPIIAFYRQSASPAINDDLGGFKFYGKDSGGAGTEYATMFADAANVADDAERGRLMFQVRSETASGTPNTIQTGLKIEGTATNDQVDVLIPNGNLKMGSGKMITSDGGTLSFDNDNLTTTGWAAIGTATRKASAYLTVQGAAPSIAMVSTATSDEGAQINFYGTTNNGGTDYSGYNNYLDAYRGQIRLISATPGGTLGGQYMLQTQPDTGDITNPAYNHLQLRGIGTIGQVKIESKLTLAGQTLVKRIESAAVTIASGVGNIVSNTHGSLVGFTSESSTTDDLDFVLIDGAAPAVGTEIYVCSSSSHDITVRTQTHSGVTGGAGAFVGRDSDMTFVHSYVLNGSADGQKMIHCIYRGDRWVILSANCASRSLTS